jgi:hypothetical protein
MPALMRVLIFIDDDVESEKGRGGSGFAPEPASFSAPTVA